MKLITEQFEDVICEAAPDSTGSGKKYTIKGVFMQAEQKNRNRRFYTMSVLQPAVDKYITEYVNARRAVGELNHPEGPKINLDKVSHRITALQWDGNSVLGEALVLDTPMGQIVKGLISGGCQLGVSSRGLGTVTSKGDYSLVNPGFVISTVDIVQDPSASTAFVEGIMEGVEWIWDNGLLKEHVLEGYQETILNASSKDLSQAKIKVFSDFLTSLK